MWKYYWASRSLGRGMCPMMIWRGSCRSVRVSVREWGQEIQLVTSLLNSTVARWFCFILLVVCCSLHYDQIISRSNIIVIIIMWRFVTIFNSVDTLPYSDWTHLILTHMVRGQRREAARTPEKIADKTKVLSMPTNWRKITTIILLWGNVKVILLGGPKLPGWHCK